MLIRSSLRQKLWALVGCVAIFAMISGCHKRADNGKPGDIYCDVISDYTSPENCTDFGAQAGREADGTAALNAPNPMNRGDAVNVFLAIAASRPKPTPVLPPAQKGSGGSPRPAPAQSSDNPPAAQPSEPAANNLPSDSAPAASASATPSPEQTFAPTPAQVVAPMPGHVEVFSLTVGQHVKATLEGDDAFQITARTPAVQNIELGGSHAATLWNWEVKALHGGVHTLMITTVVEAIDRQGQFHELVSSPHAYSFNVKVSLLGQVQDGFEQAPVWIKLVTAVVLALVALVAAIEKLRNGVLGLFGKAKAPDAD